MSPPVFDRGLAEWHPSGALPRQIRHPPRKDLGEVRCVVAPASEGRKRPERPGDSETNPTTSTPAEGSDNTDTGLTPTGVMGNISAIRHTGHAGHPPL